MQAVTDPMTLVKHAILQLQTPCGSKAALCRENTVFCSLLVHSTTTADTLASPDVQFTTWSVIGHAEHM